MAIKDELGRLGETIAAGYLERCGLRIIDRNWRCKQGELDLVAIDGTQTVFVEVKARSSVAFGHPFEAITPVKLRRLRVLAGQWREQHPEATGGYRIDAVAVLWEGEPQPKVEHLKGIR